MFYESQFHLRYISNFTCNTLSYNSSIKRIIVKWFVKQTKLNYASEVIDHKIPHQRMHSVCVVEYLSFAIYPALTCTQYHPGNFLHIILFNSRNNSLCGLYHHPQVIIEIEGLGNGSDVPRSLGSWHQRAGLPTSVVYRLWIKQIILDGVGVLHPISLKRKKTSSPQGKGNSTCICLWTWAAISALPCLCSWSACPVDFVFGTRHNHINFFKINLSLSLHRHTHTYITPYWLYFSGEL